MEEGNSISRLSKAAREFNIGISTIVEFLSKNGHEIEGKPNTKLSAEMYGILVQEFQSEKQVKEVSQKIGLEYSHHESVSLDDTKKPVVEKSDEEDEVISDNLYIKDANEDLKTEPIIEEAKTEEVIPEIVEEKVEAVEEVVEEIVKAKEEEKVVEPTIEKIAEVEPEVEVKPEVKEEIVEPIIESKVEETKVEVEAKEEIKVEDKKEEETATTEKDKDLKVLGKIDLDSINSKTKPARKTKEEKAKEAASKTKARKEAKEKPKKEAIVEKRAEEVKTPVIEKKVEKKES